MIANTIYKVYRASGTCALSDDHKQSLIDAVATYASLTHNNELERSTIAENTSIAFSTANSLQTISIDSLRAVTSTIVISHHDTPIVLISSPVVPVLIQYLEHASGCVLVPTKIHVTSLVQDVMDQMCRTAGPRSTAARLGNIELVYKAPSKSLTDISINIPVEDVQRFVTEFPASLYKFIQRCTTLQLTNLELSKFLSRSFMVARDGKVRVSVFQTETETDDTLRMVIECIHRNL